MEVQGGEDCPSGAALAGRLPQGSNARFRVEFARAGRVRVATVVRVDGPGRRVVRSVSDGCGPLAEAVVLTMSLAVDPLAVMAPRPVAVAPPVVRAPVQCTGWMGQLDLGVAGGVTPVGSMLGLGFGWRERRWSAGLEGRFQPAAVDALGAAEASVALGAAGLYGCWAAWGPLEVCGVGVAGRLWASGAGFAENASVAAPLLAGGARVRATVARWGAWRVAASAEGLGVLSQLELTYADAVVWRTERVHVSGGLSVGVHFE